MVALEAKTMEIRTYTEKSNARRAAKAAGVNPDLITETEDGFTFPAPAAMDDNLDIPPALRLSDEERREAWAKNPPKPTPHRETLSMPKPKAKKERGATGADKTATMLSMLKGKGATVEALTKATGWLPHTLRARISNVCKSKKDGGMGLKVERERTDGVTTYRLAS